MWYIISLKSLFIYLLKVSCTIKSSNKSRNIPIITRISDINDNAPLFTNVPYETTVPEVSELFNL